MSVDTKLVRQVHREVGDRLHAELERRQRAEMPPLNGDDEQQYARKLIADAIRDHTAKQLEDRKTPLDPTTERELADAVHARMYGAGPIQVLLDDPAVENIDINGCDQVWVTRAGSPHHQRVDPVAGNDEELVELVRRLGAHAGLNSRPWDVANPELDLQLPDGSRLSAVMAVTARPSVSIRRHRFHKVDLADLVDNGTIATPAADFLRALAQARFNLMIAGATRAGKTTLLRAMAAEIGPGERIITVEKALELGLRKDQERHPNCVELEERIANSEGRGAVTMTQLVRRTLRQNPDRVIVGEVLGPEVVDMLSAMGQGNDGSMSTIHARSARDVFQRIATYAIQSQERLPMVASYQLIAGGLDYVIFISRDPRTGHRRLESILEINGYDQTVLASEIFMRPEGAEAAVWTGTMPSRVDRLVAAGWTPHVAEAR